MKKILKKVMTAVLAVAMMMGMMAIPALAEDEENIESYSEVTITVKWDKAAAENKTVYAWCWSTFENYTESQSWPGDAMTKNEDGTWTITIQTKFKEEKLGFIPNFESVRTYEDGTTFDCQIQTIDLEIPGSGNVLITVSEELDLEYDNYLATVEVISDDTKETVWKYEKTDEQSVKIQGYLGDEKEIVVPAEIDGYAVKSIDGFAFNNNKTIEKVTLPEGITTIYDGAFYGCENLKNINIPDGVTLISIDAFKGCKSLMEINIPDSVTAIGKGAFDGCESLESIVIPEGVKGFGDWTFYGCSSLKSIIIPKSVTGIGREVFEGCTSMVIYCYSGSYAVTYAKENNIAYKLLDAPKPGWKRNANGWWYDNGDETYPNSTWKKIDGNWYYFNSSGYMVTGWLKDGNNWYYLESTGKMASNKWVDSIYYVKSNGAMAVNEWVDGGRYFVGSDGKWVMNKTKASWKKDFIGWWYDNGDGTYPISTWKFIDGSWYYFKNSGYMATGN